MDAEWIAELRVVFVEPNGAHRPGRIAIGRPYVVDEKQSSCPVALDGLHKLLVTHGNDPMQALLLGLGLLGMLLHNFLERGGLVLDEDGHGVALGAYFGPLLRATPAD